MGLYIIRDFMCEDLAKFFMRLWSTLARGKVTLSMYISRHGSRFFGFGYFSWILDCRWLSLTRLDTV